MTPTEGGSGSRMVEVEVTERYLIPEPPQIQLPAEDGEPLESPWHRAQINFLIESVQQHWKDRTDFFAGGNMLLYYSARQARQRDYKGPDFFVVKPTDGQRLRKAWIVWEEDGQYPNLIVELLSPTTADADLGPKKDLYERRFKTPEYFCYDPDADRLQGWRLGATGYAPIAPDPQGRLWSDELKLLVGTWVGTYQKIPATWVRFFDPSGAMVPTAAERLALLEDQA